MPDEIANDFPVIAFYLFATYGVHNKLVLQTIADNISSKKACQCHWTIYTHHGVNNGPCVVKGSNHIFNRPFYIHLLLK